MGKKYKITLYWGGGFPHVWLCANKPNVYMNNSSMIFFTDAETGKEIIVSGTFFIEEVKNEKNS